MFNLVLKSCSLSCKNFILLSLVLYQVDGLEIKLKRMPNLGLLNPLKTNICWLNSVLQLLELSSISLFLEGLEMIITIIMHAFKFHVAGFPDKDLTSSQREYKVLHRTLQERTCPADPSMLMVYTMHTCMHAYNVFEFIQAVMTSATSTNLDIGRSNDADEGLQTLLEQLVNGLEVHNAIV